MTTCNHTSVGVLVVRDGRLLLIERRKPPYGWAPPAGHVEAGETYAQAAERELAEEVGLRALQVRHLWNHWYRRPGGDWQWWEFFEATTEGESVCSGDETRGLRWASRPELDALAVVTTSHLRANADLAVWQANPGLEPVWLEILRTLSVVAGTVFPRVAERERKGSDQ